MYILAVPNVCGWIVLLAHYYGRRAKIKSLAKKSIETGEDCDAIPDSYRTYLQLQALETGRPLMRNLTQTGGTASYSTGSLNLGGDNPSNQKVGEYSYQWDARERSEDALLTPGSHPPLLVSRLEHWELAPCGSERYGPRHFLLCRRKALPYVLH